MATKNDQGKLRVLVADDNSTNIEVVSKMLKLEDIYDVTIAKDGQEAYELVKANMERDQRFDVIFMDIQMPNLDGIQSTKLIRKMGYSAPIVALTAFSDESNVKDCMDSGMDEFLAKPIRRPALKQVLKKFATIPEEPETTELTKKTTPEQQRQNKPTVNGAPTSSQEKKPDDVSVSNGSTMPVSTPNGQI
jgi:osomolarity two-component system sensor histidine kinase SLN1